MATEAESHIGHGCCKVMVDFGTQYYREWHMSNKIAGLIVILCIFTWRVSAQDETAAEDVLPPPDIPERIQSGEAIEPEVTIIRREDEIIEEYRVSGNLYMIKITPSVGPAYYLIDQDGDGKLESRTTRLGSDSAVPQWVIFSWGGGKSK